MKPYPIVIKINDESMCWECTSHVPIGIGYIRVRVNNKNIYLHRYYYEKYKGKISEGMVVRHMCDNKICCNPDHLETGTQKDNMNDMKIRGRASKGEGSPHAKLKEEDVINIRLSLLNNQILAKQYNVSDSLISAIRNNRAWNHIAADKVGLRKAFKKLTLEIVEEIRKSEWNTKKIAEFYSISTRTVLNIKSFKGSYKS